MSRKKAFTLIELLVVISIIALLLSILMPALNAAKKQAQDVIDKANQKAQGQIAMTYAVDYKDKLFPDWFSNTYYMNVLGQNQSDALANCMWQYCTESYWQDPKILFCPSATKIAGINGRTPDIRESGTPEDQVHWGHTAFAWRTPWARPLKATKKVCASSYGVNDFVATPYRADPALQASVNKIFWGSMRQKNADRIPFIFDCAWYSIMPNSDAKPSPLEYDKNHTDGAGGGMDPALLPRHRGAINMTTLDLSVRRTSLKSLWTYKWHKQFDTNNIWTRSGALWPEWMKKLKD